MKDAITDAALTKQEEDTATKLYRTLDAAQMANIQTTEPRNARKRFLAIADRLNLSPADEKRREIGGGSLQKFWTLAQINAVKAEYEKSKSPVTLYARIARIKKLSAATTQNIIEIGRELIAAKSEVGHGNWANWLKDNFGWTQQTANNFMRVAERFGDKPEFTEFKPSTLQAMLALPIGSEQDFINVQAEIKPVENQSERELKAAVKQYKKRKKNPAPVTKPAADSEPVNHISANDEDGKTENVFVFEGDKPHNDAILQGYNTPCQDPATQPADALTIQEVDSETVTTSGDNTANDSPADETADALIDSELADIFARIDKITDADKLRRIQAHISNRLAEIGGKKNKPANTDASR